ncbi:DUF5723 family protein [uncultured Algibacter sp.]|uniref:DUF5723 family protein n=1 Tax=uncultured Algibacter sp. TaxID=298659 RepID=UPI00262CF1B7|nr:DUF5723 family protein [uncultured Algibacter sp.]
MKIRSTLILFLLWFVSFSQNKQIVYGFLEIPQSLILNPGGKVGNKGYIGVPLLSHIHVNGGTTGATVYDVFANDGVNFNTKLRNAVNSMNDNDYISFNQQLDLFSAGFAFGSSYEKNEYLSFGLYQELDMINYFPQDYAILALEGNQNNINKVFDLSDFSLSAEVISVFHMGYNKKVNSKLNYGFRGKIYSSIVNVNSTRNKGRFVTVPGNDNVYDHIFDLNLKLRTSGIASLDDDQNSDSEGAIKTIANRVLFGGNLGLGFDVGFSYNITKQWTVDGSLLDIGFIHHSKDVENHELKGDYVFEGINPIFPESNGSETADDYWSEIEEDFEELFNIDVTNKSYTTWRPIKLNASLNYAFGEKKEEDCNCIKEELGYLNATGVQLYAVNRPRRPQLALTTYYYRYLFKGLRLKATYTIDSYSFYNLGIGLSAHIGRMNFYAMADNFIQYKNIYDAEGVSLQLGFNYIFKKNEN